MAKEIKNLILLLRLACRTFQANNTFGSYHRYVRRVAWRTIRKSQKQNDGTIPERVYKKIQWYMVTSVFMGEILAELTGHSLKKKEKESYIYLGALMALFDAIIDDFKIENTVAMVLFRNAFTKDEKPVLKINTTVEKIFDIYLKNFLGVTAKERWPEIKKQIDLIQFQLKSYQQLKKDINEESIRIITTGKGGGAILLCASLLPISTETFKKCLMELGGFIQMMNDCQDMYKDTREGITTFVHFCKSFREIFDKLDFQRKITFKELKSLPCSYKGRHNTIFNFYAMYVAISYKLQKYAEICDNKIDFRAMAGMPKENFRVNPFSPRAIVSCFGQIMKYDYNTCDINSIFEFKNSN